MAGISGFSFKPVYSRRPISSSSSSSSQSQLWAVRFNNPNGVSIDGSRCVITAALSGPVTARYGGYRPGSNQSRRPRELRQVEYDADPAIDISSIKSSTVRLIDAQQNMIGVVSKSQAIEMAADAELDLVILSPDSDPPVVRIMDYNKYRYEQQKRKRDQQKKSAASRVDIKELKMGYNIDSHDYSVRLKAAQKFLKDGDKVKIIVNLKGRENEFRNIAIELLKRFQNDIGELGIEESKNFRDRNIFLILIPNKTVQQKAQETPKQKDKPVSEVSASV